MQPHLRADDEPTLRLGPSRVSDRISNALNTMPAADAGLGERRLKPGDLLAGRYRIQERIGSGGMGVVYRAYDEQIGFHVAVKVLRPDLAGNERLEARLRRELVLARQVSHRNAVQIHDLGQDRDLLFLVMDLVDGRSLRDVLTEEGPMSPEQAAAIARQLALALEAAHQEGIVHRDLKPANVLVDDSGRAWITDFGVARSLHDPGFTRPGAVVGTLAYLSPEQARGAEVDGRGDLYALGILLFEMLTGELPFPGGGSGAEAMAQRLSGASRDLRTLRDDVPAWLAAIVRRLLQRDASRRFQSAREVIDALDGIGHLPRVPVRHVAAVLVLPVLLTAGWTFTRREGSSQAAVVPPPAAPIHTVAVLPLVDETGRSDLAWISRGLAEMIANDLRESPALRIVDSSRVFQTVHDLGISEGQTAGDLRRLAELLDADRLIAGRIWAAGGRLRADLRVVGSTDASTSAAVHAEEESERRIFDLAGELGRELRESLAVEPPAAKPVAASPAGLRAYYRGIELLQHGEDRSAVEELRKAVAADPELTPAWMQLARALSAMGRQGEAREAARRAEGTASGRSGRAAWETRALVARLDGEPEKAREILSDMLARHPYDTEAWIELAEVCSEQGDLNAAIANLRRVVTEAPTHPRAWFLLAKASILAGNSRQAADEYLVRALVIQNRLGNEAGRAEVVNAMGVAYQDLGMPDSALASYEEAAAIRHRIGDERGEAASLRNIAAIHLVRGEPALAEARLGEALALLQRLDDPAGMAELYNDLGLLEEERGRYPNALAYHRRSLQLRRPLGRPLALAESLRNVGWTSYLLGRYDDAMVYWSQGLELARRAGDQAGVVLGQQDIGMLHIVYGDWDDGLKSFLDALQKSRELEMPDAAAASLGHIGRIAHLQGRYPAALKSFVEALAILRDLGDIRGETEFTLAEAETWLRLGDLQTARTSLDTAERLLAKEGNHEQRSDLLRLRADWLHRSGKPEPARKAAAEALAEAEASGAVAVLFQARLAKARLAGAEGLPELRRLKAEADQLGHRVLQLRVSDALSEFESVG